MDIHERIWIKFGVTALIVVIELVGDASGADGAGGDGVVLHLDIHWVFKRDDIVVVVVVVVVVRVGIVIITKTTTQYGAGAIFSLCTWVRVPITTTTAPPFILRSLKLCIDVGANFNAGY